MLVDNPFQQSIFSTTVPPPSSSTPSFADLSNDLSEFLNTELFSSLTSSTSPAAGSSSSRSSSPQSPFQSILTTPPQQPLATSFPEVHEPSVFMTYGGNNGFNINSSNTLFNFLEEDMKLIDPMALSMSTTLAPYDFFGAIGSGGGSSSSNSTNASSTSTSPIESSTSHVMAIDPQLVQTPSSQALSEFGDDDDSEGDDEEEIKEAQKPTEKLTFTIAPVKVGGHGKGRKGTVQSGGVVKKAPPPPSIISASSVPTNSALFSSAANKDKENVVNGRSSTPRSFKASEDDDLPDDWRPSPEALQKMTSKEKRQLRNKISARNFRVRRKEYITTLELDIAERDRLLQAIRSELGSTQSENVALRQEIEALKKALLEGRTGILTPEDIPSLNLPPPAPLPPVGAAAAAAAATTAIPTHTLVTPNTHKDMPNMASPRLGAFWGGVPNVGLGLGGGVTPVHTVLVPELSTLARNVNRGGLQENINPAMNSGVFGALNGKSPFGGFDGFADGIPFTMKSLDAYRMQLWTKMASQHSQQQASNNHRTPTPPPLISSPSPFTTQPLPGSSPNMFPYSSPNMSPLNGLASSLKPAFFSASNKPNLPASSSSSPPLVGSTLSTLLAGKHTSAGNFSTYPTPPSTPPHLAGFFGKRDSSSPSAAATAASLKEKEKERDQAVIATLASQTLLKKLGGAFWDAFSGSSASNSSSDGAKLAKHFDADKVRKVLEGKAVVRVVDIEPAPTGGATGATLPSSSLRESPKPATLAEKDCVACVSSILEESMRSLTLGKK